MYALQIIFLTIFLSFNIVGQILYKSPVGPKKFLVKTASLLYYNLSNLHAGSIVESIAIAFGCMIAMPGVTLVL